MIKKRKKKQYPFVQHELDEIASVSTGKEKSTKERQKRFTKHYLKTGINPMDVWSLDCALAKWLVPRLKILKEVKGSIPGYLCVPVNPELGWESKTDWPASQAKRDAIIDIMLEGFEFMLTDDYFGYNKKMHAKVAKAFKTLANNYGMLSY